MLAEIRSASAICGNDKPPQNHTDFKVSVQTLRVPRWCQFDLRQIESSGRARDRITGGLLHTSGGSESSQLWLLKIFQMNNDPEMLK